VARVSLFELGIAGLGETEPPLRVLALTLVCKDGWYQVQVVGMEAENAQEPGELREIAADDPFQIGHPASQPVIEVLRRQQIQADEDIDWGDNLAVLQDLCHNASDARVERVFAIIAAGNSRFPGPSCPHGQAQLVAFSLFHVFMIQICEDEG